MDFFLSLYHWAVLGGLLLITGNALLNAFLIPTLAGASNAQEPADAPSVSVLVPARNEEGKIGRCAGSLRRQDYPDFEVIVLDDCSEDGSWEELREAGFKPGAGENFRALRGEPLPPGWNGKSWACHQLAREARGEFLLFTDADTEHAPGSIRCAVAHAEASRADLLTLWPRQETGSWSEILVIPLLYVLAAAFTPHILVTLIQRNPGLLRFFSRRNYRFLGLANGQYLLFRRAAYDAIGGHEAIREELVEDVALGRRIMDFAGEGMRLNHADGRHLVCCRMYRSFAELWRGFSKNLRPLFGRDLAAFLCFGGVQAVLLVAPFFFLPFAGAHRTLVLVQIALIVFLRVFLALRYRSGWWSVAGHPAGYLLSFAMGLNSWRLMAGGGVTWKGRVYRG
ncbi:MAG: glycosyltransferase [Verrucomicrobiales bacterium]